jgi:hypothetical protein
MHLSQLDAVGGVINLITLGVPRIRISLPNDEPSLVTNSNGRSTVCRCFVLKPSSRLQRWNAYSMWFLLLICLILAGMPWIGSFGRDRLVLWPLK